MENKGKMKENKNAERNLDKFIQENIEQNREYNLSLIYIIGYAVLYLTSYFLDNGVKISYWLSELNSKVSFYVGLDAILEIFLPGVIFSLFLWKCFEIAYSYGSESKFGEQVIKREYSERMVSIMKYVMVLFIAWMNVGNSVHVVANHLNNRAFNFSHDFSDPSYAALYYEIYYWDEFFGHINMMLPLFGFLFIYLLGIVHFRRSIKLKWFEWLFIFLAAIGFGLAWFFGWAEGQCLLLASMVEFILLIIVIYYISTKKESIKIKLKEHPFMVFVLVQAVEFIIATIIWGIVEGVKPYYPFFYQPGEELWSILLRL
ncbi:MAG: hypothetical protein ACTSU2_12970 [Promethearchaeota archaeon]